MNIISQITYTPKILSQNIATGTKKYETPVDKFERSGNAKNPSFKSTPNIFKEIINNPELMKKYMAFLTCGIGTLFAAANINTEKSEQNGTQTDGNDIFSFIMRGFQHQETNQDNSSEISALNKAIEELTKENESLKSQLTNQNQAQIADEKVSCMEYPNEDSANVTFEEKPEGNRNETKLVSFEFPKKHGRLTKVQSGLKVISEGLELSEEDNRKYYEICKILIQAGKEYTTKSGIILQCEQLTDSIKKELETSEKNDISCIIDKYYKHLELDNNKQNVLIDEGNESNAPKQNNTENVKHHIETPLERVRNNPITLTPRGHIEESRKRPRIPQNKEKQILDDEKNKVISSESIEPVVNIVEKLDTTPQDPFISFSYKCYKLTENLFAPPETYSSKNRLTGKTVTRFKNNTAGDITKILINFEKYFTNLPSNEQRLKDVRIWANNIMHNTSLTELNPNMANVVVRTTVDRYVAKNVTMNELIYEINTKSDYVNINQAIDNAKNNRYEDLNNNYVLMDILDAINSDERFENFSVHGAMRLIERLVDFNSESPIQEQCTYYLDHIYALLERALMSGVQVKTYTCPIDRTNKNGDIIVMMNPNLIISPSLYTEEDKKIFGEDEIVISLCEYQSGTNYNKYAKTPLIKTIFIKNAW